MRDQYEENAQGTNKAIVRTYALTAVVAMVVVTLLFVSLPTMTAFIIAVIIAAAVASYFAYAGTHNTRSSRR